MRSNKSMNLSGRTTSSLHDLILSEINRQSSFPRTLLGALDGDLNSSDNSKFRLENSLLAVAPSKPKPQLIMKSRKPTSPYKFITTLFNSPMRKRKTTSFKHEKQQPLLRCFSYEEISKATNYFHPGNKISNIA